MQLIFTRSNTAESRLIQLLTGSHWSHVAVVDGLKVIDSMADLGVRRRSQVGFLQAFPDYRWVNIPTSHDSEALSWLREQVGKPYDGSALWGFLMPWREWAEDDAWFCSELAAAALVAAGVYMPQTVNRITPGHLYDLVTRNRG